MRVSRVAPEQAGGKVRIVPRKRALVRLRRRHPRRGRIDRSGSTRTAGFDRLTTRVEKKRLGCACESAFVRERTMNAG